MILSRYFKSVPSNPHYYFYFPLPCKKQVDSEDDMTERRCSEELVSDAEPTSEDGEDSLGETLTKVAQGVLGI
ncbi:hypothetical protein AMECASPLE_038959 [Ameca splendens]|uniref:Uncharacterized protein n=1 Tax=Ameca splendens TaxID=208324 RepID=A0ABV0ZT92_9TELE